MSYQYVMRNNKRLRPTTKHIVITHLPNLIEKFFIDPSAVSHNNYFTAGLMEKYFMYDLDKRTLPYHYYLDNIGNDWYVFKGLCEFQPSYFLEDLVSAGVMKYEYKDAILIVISDDYSIHNIDTRMCEHLANKVLSDLIRRYSLDIHKVKYIDECMVDNWEEHFKLSRLNYNYKEAKYFNPQIMKSEYNKFKK